MKQCAPRFHPNCAAHLLRKGRAAPLIPAVTGRTRRGFAPALGGGKGAAGVQAACSARASRGGPLWVRCPHPVCPPHSFEQDEDTLFIPRPQGEVKGQFLLHCVKKMQRRIRSARCPPAAGRCAGRPPPCCFAQKTPAAPPAGAQNAKLWFYALTLHIYAIILSP